MKNFTTILMVLILVFSDTLALTDTLALQKTRKIRWYIPQYIPIQFAGSIGLVSAGAGYRNRNDRYQLSLVYGHAPKAVAGVKSHLLTAKNIFHFTQFFLNEKQRLIPYGALGISWEVGGRSFFNVPDNMPDGYYDFPKSIHAIPGVGLKLRHRTDKIRGFSGLEIFTEFTTVDAYIWYKFLSKEVKMHQIVSLAFGVHLVRK